MNDMTNVRSEVRDLKFGVVDLLISHVLPVEKFQEGFDAIKEKRALKVALLFGGDR